MCQFALPPAPMKPTLTAMMVLLRLGARFYESKVSERWPKILVARDAIFKRRPAAVCRAGRLAAWTPNQ